MWLRISGKCNIINIVKRILFRDDVEEMRINNNKKEHNKCCLNSQSSEQVDIDGFILVNTDDNLQ